MQEHKVIEKERRYIIIIVVPNTSKQWSLD